MMKQLMKEEQEQARRYREEMKEIDEEVQRKMKVY
jgi:hypothetical protein